MQQHVKISLSARHDNNKCQTENKSVLCIEFFLPLVVEHRRQRNTWNFRTNINFASVCHAREEPWRFCTRWLALPGVLQSSTVESLQIKFICTVDGNGLNSLHDCTTSNPGRWKFIRSRCHNATRKWIISIHTHDCIWINLIFGSSFVCNECHASNLQLNAGTKWFFASLWAGTCFYLIKCLIYNEIHKQIALHVNRETHFLIYHFFLFVQKRKFQQKRQNTTEKNANKNVGIVKFTNVVHAKVNRAPCWRSWCSEKFMQKHLVVRRNGSTKVNYIFVLSLVSESSRLVCGWLKRGWEWKREPQTTLSHTTSATQSVA